MNSVKLVWSVTDKMNAQVILLECEMLRAHAIASFTFTMCLVPHLGFWFPFYQGPASRHAFLFGMSKQRTATSAGDIAPSSTQNKKKTFREHNCNIVTNHDI